MTRSVRITVWSDYVCPFCYLEEPILDRIRREYDERVELEWRAFELRPAPVPTLDPKGEYLRTVWNQAVYPMARERGMTLRLPPLQPRSRRALELAEFARTRERFDDVHRGLFKAFFENGRDIDDLETLIMIELQQDWTARRCAQHWSKESTA
ncbi:MAG: DsbA family protein, partial [Nitrospirales bacterium]